MKYDSKIHYWAHMLDEAFEKRLLNEGKHWPEDYLKDCIQFDKKFKVRPIVLVF